MKLLTLLFSFYNLKWKAITIPQLIDFSKHFLSTKIHFLWWSCTSVDFLTDCDSFHLCLFDFPLIYQFYSIMTTLVRTICWNPAELIIWKSFHHHFKRIWRGLLIKIEMQLLLLPLLKYSAPWSKKAESGIFNFSWFQDSTKI